MTNERSPIMHEIKLLGVKYCDAVYQGAKPFEVRKNDRDYRVGDFVTFVSMNHRGKRIKHPIDCETYIITFVLNTFPALEKGYCVFGIKPVKND